MKAIISVLQQSPYIARSAAPYGALVSLFCGFMYWNGGIVLGPSYSSCLYFICEVSGDKTNHVAVIHLPQIFYFYSFAACFCWPILLADSGGLRRMFYLLKSMLFNNRR